MNSNILSNMRKKMSTILIKSTKKVSLNIYLTAYCNSTPNNTVDIIKM